MTVRLGRYELNRLLGVGGQGRVYEAVLHGPGGLRKPVALKLLPSGAGMVREARIGGLLRHPNLVDVYEVGEVGGTWFCAMEVCDETLSDRIPLPPRAVVEVGLQVCAALRYAHEELGLVHLDLKPQNLLLSGATVKVADLGIARARGFADDRRIAGTRGYMSPEQSRGEPVDARSDVYSLGVVLMVLARGQLPRSSDTFSVDEALTDEALSDDAIGAVDPELVWLLPVLDRCLDPDPAGRFGSMVELAEALRGLDAPGLSLRDLVGAAAPPARHRADTNLDDEIDAFVGRDAELEALAGWLAAPCLLTLKGPGGIGKTRLARHAARERHLHTGAQAWFCDLAEVRTQADLLRAVASAIDVPLQAADEGAVARLGHALAARGDAVVILDNFEQILSAAPVVARWRALAPELRLVVTSREPLRIDGERIVDVETLNEPDAVALLRARARDRGVEIGEDPSLAEIAARLDGVPLALELAAGRIGVLSPAEVRDRLGLSLLRSGRADLSDRQATLRGALDWSWGLLSEPERDALAQLSVFRRGFTLDAVEAVVALADAAAWDVLQSLVDRSLVRSSRGDRFDLLVSVQEYAAEQLAASPGGSAGAEGRHGDYFAGKDLPRILETMHGVGGPTLRRSLVADVDNLLVACRRAIARDDGAIASRALNASWAVLDAQGPFSVAMELAEAVRKMPGATARQRATAAWVAGSACVQQGSALEGRDHLLVALDGALAAGDTHFEGHVLGTLGTSCRVLGRADEARAYFERSLAIQTRVNGRIFEGMILVNLGILHQNQSRVEASREQYDAALKVARSTGDVACEGFALGNLGNLELDLGHPDAARSCYEAALAALSHAGHRRMEAVVLGNLALLDFEQGHLESAGARNASAIRAYREMGDRRSEGYVLGSMGALLHEQRRVAEARAHCEAALVIHREVGNRRSEGVMLDRLGLIALDAGRDAEARALFEAALAIQREVGHRGFEAIALSHIAAVDGRAGAHEAAVEGFAKGEALLREARYPVEVGKLLLLRARYERSAGLDATGTLAEAARLAEEAGSATELGRLLAQLARVGSGA